MLFLKRNRKSLSLYNLDVIFISIMSHKYKVATEQIITVHDHFCGALANNAIGLDKGNIDKKSIIDIL